MKLTSVSRTALLVAGVSACCLATGFAVAHTPVGQWIADMAHASPEGQGVLNLEDFSQPELFAAIYSGDFDALETAPLYSLTYMDGIVQELTSSNALMYTDPQIAVVVNPSVNTRIARRLARSPAAIVDAQRQGWGFFGDVIKTYVQSTEDGRSVEDSVADLVEVVADSPAVKLEQLKQEGHSDGRKLALLFMTDRPLFNRVYKNIEKFVG